MYCVWPIGKEVSFEKLRQNLEMLILLRVVSKKPNKHMPLKFRKKSTIFWPEPILANFVQSLQTIFYETAFPHSCNFFIHQIRICSFYKKSPETIHIPLWFAIFIRTHHISILPVHRDLWNNEIGLILLILSYLDTITTYFCHCTSNDVFSHCPLTGWHMDLSK